MIYKQMALDRDGTRVKILGGLRKKTVRCTVDRRLHLVLYYFEEYVSFFSLIK